MDSPIVQALLEQCWDMKIPVEPEVFAAHLGLTVEMRDGLGLAASRFDPDSKTIVVNADACPERRRFAIARELGHYCLGHCRRVDAASDPVRFAADAQEQESQACIFAAELLMPAIAVKVLADRRGIRDAKTLREMLGVSSQALNWRLNALGYFL